MRRTPLLIAITLSAAIGQNREVFYPGAGFGNDPIPKFDKGYLLFLKHPCRIAVFRPTGTLAYVQDLKSPDGGACSILDSTVDSDGTVAVSFGYSTNAGYAAGINLLNPSGAMSLFIDTKRYVPSHICFDVDHSLWSIGWQRDEARNQYPDEKDYPVVRKFSRAGRETGAYIPRSLWGRKGEPGSASLGLWAITAGRDRVAALVYENHADNAPELVEWDLNGNLLARTPLPPRLYGGKAYTASGRFFARVEDESSNGFRLVVLDRTNAAWKPVSVTGGDESAWGLLLGADGDDLVISKRLSSTTLVWVRP